MALRLPDYDFELDGFQRRAVEALEDGKSVLVAAPTGGHDAGIREGQSHPSVSVR